MVRAVRRAARQPALPDGRVVRGHLRAQARAADPRARRAARAAAVQGLRRGGRLPRHQDRRVWRRGGALVGRALPVRPRPDLDAAVGRAHLAVHRGRSQARGAAAARRRVRRRPRPRGPRGGGLLCLRPLRRLHLRRGPAARRPAPQHAAAQPRLQRATRPPRASRRLPTRRGGGGAARWRYERLRLWRRRGAAAVGRPACRECRPDEPLCWAALASRLGVLPCWRRSLPRQPPGTRGFGSKPLHALEKSAPAARAPAPAHTAATTPRERPIPRRP